jgi:hypothetical protein
MNYSHPGQDWQPVWQGNRGVGRQTLEIQKENPGAPDSAMLHGRKPSILKPMVNEYYASRMDKIGGKWYEEGNWVVGIQLTLRGI